MVRSGPLILRARTVPVRAYDVYDRPESPGGCQEPAKIKKTRQEPAKRLPSSNHYTIIVIIFVIIIRLLNNLGILFRIKFSFNTF
jgi:hypothetical protein